MTRILVAEDSATQAVHIRGILEEANYQVEVVANGRQALRRLASGDAPELVLTDMMMPELDGLEATREIRQAESAGGRIPIVAMTANAMQGDREMCLEAGMDGYVAKPVKKDALFAEIDRVLDGGKGGQSDGHHV